MNRKPQC